LKVYLYSQQQQRVAFVDFQREVITDVDGYSIAFLANEAVFDRTGKHVTWWMGSYLSDLHGRVLLVAAEAFVPGLALPRPARSSQPPPQRPFLPPRLHLSSGEKPPCKPVWANAQAFVTALVSARMNAPEENARAPSSDIGPILRSIGALPSES
jgi:hypothetical protein